MKTRSFAPGLVGSVMLLAACGSSDKSKDPAKPEARMLGMEIEGETSVEKYDLNGDGNPDLIKTYILSGPKDDPEKRTHHLGRQDLDPNSDGKIDVRRRFNELGSVVREEMDLDFDGNPDAVDYYQDGKLYRRDMSLNFEGKPSIVKYYADDKLARKERDTNGDGKIDTVEFYEGGKLVRIGVDKDGDEKSDVYTEIEQGGGEGQ